MTIFVDLHVVTRANPRAVGDLLVLVRIETAGAERLAERVEIGGQAEDDDIGRRGVGVGGRA